MIAKIFIISIVPYTHDVGNHVRYGHPAGGATPAGQGGEEHAGVSDAQNSFTTCEYIFSRR